MYAGLGTSLDCVAGAAAGDWVLFAVDIHLLEDLNTAAGDGFEELWKQDCEVFGIALMAPRAGNRSMVKELRGETE